ncbi:MAG TPA: mismatch-specific DNA-glycosylase [Myxococcales bacterium]|nr:mismatch-specific DNA-glycosylase [Myxococcales bacterium]
MGRVPDILLPRPRVLFVGINPGLRSGEVGHHFAGPGNPFWRLLHASRLTAEPLGWESEARLRVYGFGLTNLCPRVTRAASELGKAEIERGRRRLLAKIERLRPRVVALVGVTLYRQLLPAARTPGPGAKPEELAGARLYVLPNPSGLNASYPSFASKLVWFERLRDFERGRGSPPPRNALDGRSSTVQS